MGTETIPSNEDTGKKISDLEQKIIRQVEYYFGNYNLRKDKFLREKTTLDDGWIPLETLVTFNRLKNISDDYSIICEALKKSPNELLEVNEDSTKVRRRLEKPVPEESTASIDSLDERTLYVKGFKKTNTLDELLDFFKGHKSEHIYMRRRQQNKSKVFKGSCFIMFETREDADKFLETKGIKYEGTELLKERKKEYVKRKDIYYENLRAEKEKKLAKKNVETPKEGNVEVNVSEIEITPGCLLKITGLGQSSSREDMKEALDSYGTIVFVDYFRGKPEGVVRFESGVAASVLEKAEEVDGVKKMSIGSIKATVSVIEGDEEKEYWKNIAISRANAKQRHNQYQKQSRGRFKKNWGKRQKWGNRDDESSERPAKKAKFESSDDKQGNDQSFKVKDEPMADANNKHTEVLDLKVKEEPKGNANNKHTEILDLKVKEEPRGDANTKQTKSLTAEASS